MKGDHVHICGGRSVSLNAQGLPQSTGTVHQAREGQPLPEGAELLRPLGGGCYESMGRVDGKSGPAQVSSSAYREGYDRIFGTRAPVGQA